MLLRHIPYLLLTWLMLCGPGRQAMAQPLPLLEKMAKQDSLVSSRITLNFSSLPEYRIVPSGQRVDLFFSNTKAAPNLNLLAEDDKIVKILLATTSNEFMVSLLLRQVPANVSATVSQATRSLELELFWQQVNGNRPAIAFRISGLPSRQSETSSSLLLLKSDYKGRWHEFFNDYRAPHQMDLPLTFSLPVLPRYGFEESSAPYTAILQKLEEQNPQAALEQLGKLSAAELNPVGQAQKQLLSAEALLRSGNSKEALARLENLPQQQLSEALKQRAGYLRNLAMLLSGDPFGALAWQKNLEQLLGDGPYRPPFQLLQGETALLNGDGELALTYLRRDQDRWPEPLRAVQQKRIANALVITGRSQEALPYYQNLLKTKEFPTGDLFSFQLGARTFFENKQWSAAQTLYQQLTSLLSEREDRSQALYLSILATYLSGDEQGALLQFRIMREDYAGTSGELRAWLKTLDHGMTTREERHLLQGLRDYPVIISRTQDRLLREEAFMKKAITRHLHGENLRAIEILGKFRREYASSALRGEAENLMAEILQPEIEGLIARGQDLQAVVLLEKYRGLLIRGDGKWPFLPQLAKAFTRLGLFERGCRVYLFLLDHARTADEAEAFYWPLASLYYDRDEYTLSERYSKDYLEKYPKGADRSELFLLRLRSLYNLARFDEAAELLSQKQSPRNNAIELLAARIHWERGDYEQVIEFANQLGSRGEPVPPAGLLLQAEALRRLGHGQQALPLYEVLLDDGTFSDQASYRCGQLLLSRGDRSRALKLFQALVEKGNDNLWQKLARDFIAAETY